MRDLFYVHTLNNVLFFSFVTCRSFPSIGCIVDDENRALEVIEGVSPFQSTSMTFDLCAGHCAGYRYFGIQNANEVRFETSKSLETSRSESCTFDWRIMSIEYNTAHTQYTHVRTHMYTLVKLGEQREWQTCWESSRHFIRWKRLSKIQVELIHLMK